MSEHQWRQLVLTCDPGFDDIVSSLLFDAGITGLVEEPAPGGGALLKATYDLSRSPDASRAFSNALASLESRTGGKPVRIGEETIIPAQDWEIAWRQGLDAIEIGARLVVRPSWVPYLNRENRTEVIIDPRMAFGTGHHGTTALCLEEFEFLDVRGKRVIDAGIGSGVLAIAAAKMGAQEVHGFDNDDWSVINARDNAVANGVGSIVTVDLAELSAWQAAPADIVLANLISGVIIANLPNLRHLLAPGGTIVFSGILREEEPSFTSAVSGAGFVIRRVTRRDEWIAVIAGLRQD